MGWPRLTIAAALLVLAALAATMTYTGFLGVGMLADYLGTSRFLAGMLLGALFARFPWVSNGKLRIIGLLPTPVRLPLLASLLALCLLRLVMQGDVVSAFCAGFTLVFVLGFPWLKKRLFARLSSSVFNFAAGQKAAVVADNTVIEGEFREMKD
ncbi:MAG: hypothetical protein M3Y65_02075 [Pseudomonadota bacterium]|nr:hypothetical protein [Pseudomonadota bacterium]